MLMKGHFGRACWSGPRWLSKSQSCWGHLQMQHRANQWNVPNRSLTTLVAWDQVNWHNKGQFCVWCQSTYASQRWVSPSLLTEREIIWIARRVMLWWIISLLGRKPEGLIAARRGGLKDTFDSLESLENFERKYKRKASLVSETLTFEYPVWVSQVEISLTDRHSGEQPLCWSATGGTESVAATLTRGASKSTVNIRFVRPYQSLFISFPLLLGFGEKALCCFHR